MINTEAFSERLQTILNYYSISAAAFAESINIPRSSISHILSGRNKPSLEFVLKTIDKYDDIDILWLTKGEGSFPKSNNHPPTPLLKDSTNLFSQEAVPSMANTKQETANTTTSKPIDTTKKTPSQSKKIEKVLFFYTDGSFSEHKPTD